MPRQTNLNKPGAMRHMPEPPAFLSPKERGVWKQTLGVRPAAEWSASDAHLLAVYCVAAADVARLDGEIRKSGETLCAPNGSMVVHPLVAVRARREKTLLDCANRLRLTPSSRYTAKDVGRLARHAAKATAAEALLDDDLLAATETRYEH